MKNLTKLIGIIALVAVIGFSFAACDNDTGHTHSYSTTWSYNATQHWHECSCGDKADVANHTGDPCSVCSYSWTWTAVTDSTIWEYQTTLDDDDETYTFMIPANINAVAYGNNKWVAVGDRGKMATSDNGASWTAVADSKFPATYTSGSSDYEFSYSINAIAYGGNRFVAVGQQGKIAYSDNGTTWKAVADSTIWQYTDYFDRTVTADINAIAYGNGKFVAVGEQGKTAYSDDGEIWTAANKTSSSAIAYGNGRWVTGYYYSDDGENWTAATDNSISFHRIAYGNNRFVAVGGSGEIAYSSDGITWTAVADSTFPATYTFDDIIPDYPFSYSINGIAYGNNRFVAGGQYGRMAYSDNGVNWTAVANSAFGSSSDFWLNSDIEAIAYGNGRFVAVGERGKIAYADF